MTIPIVQYTTLPTECLHNQLYQSLSDLAHHDRQKYRMHTVKWMHLHCKLISHA